MSSLGDLYFALGLDDKEFNNALDAAKKRVAELTGNVPLTINVDASKIAEQVQENLNKITSKKAKINVEIDNSNAEKIKDYAESLTEARNELNEKLNAKVIDQSGIENAKRKVEFFERKLAEAKASANELSGALQEVSQSSSSIQHIVDENTVNEIRSLSSAMSDLNAQMEVANRLREGQIEYNKKQKEEKDRIKEEKNALKEKTVEMERFSKAWMDVAKVQRDQSNEQEAKVLEERMRFSEQWMSAEKSMREQNRRAEAESLRQQAANAKATKKELKEQLSVIFQIEDAVRRLQTMKVKLNTSGIDQESEGYKKASNAIDDYIDKLQKLQGSGAKLSKKSISLDLKQGMREVTMEVNSAIAGQKRLNAESKKAEKSQSEVAKKAKQFAKAFKDSSNWASQFNNQITNAFSIYAIERFIRNLYTVGGEFQKQEIALRNMIGDAGKANILFERMKDLSVKSPFTFSELSSYTKQMAAYGIEYNELYDTTKRLADISAGVGVDMGRLILAYGQVRSAEVLRGQELRQFTEAGIPIVAELAKRLEEVRGKSVAIGEVFDAISKREISFGMVKDVLFDMTDPGGKFFKTQEELAESLAGKWSNLKDAWDIMIADIANGNNTILASLADNLAWITRNWENWLPIVTGVTLAIGSYKAIIEATTIAQSVFNAVTKANPWVALASIIGGAAFAVWGYASNAQTVTEKLEEQNKELDKNIQRYKDNQNLADRYIDSLKAQNTSEEKRVKLLEELERLYPSVFKSMDREQNKLRDTASLKRDVANATKEQIKESYQKLIADAEAQRIELQKKYNDTYIQTGAQGENNIWHTQLEEVKASISEYKKERDLLLEEFEWKKSVTALGENSAVEEYVKVYGEIGKAVKILRDAGIKNGNLTSPSMSDRDLIEYYEKLNSALIEQETIMKNFKVGSDTYNKASASAEVYKKAIEAINGVWNTKDGKDARREAERAAKERAKQDLDAYIDALKERIKEISSKWSLFKELMDVTGNRQMALNLSELGNIGFKDELEHLRSEMTKELSDLNINISAGDVLNMSMDELNKAVGDKDKLKRIQTIYDAYHNANRSLRTETIKDFAEIIKASRDFEAQIAEIERKLQEDLSKLREGSKKAGLSTDTEEYKRAESQLRKEAEKKKTEVRFEEFKESSNWVKVFDDLDRVSNATLDDMIAKIEAFAGSAEISQKELKELVEALSKLRKESIERNPFGGLANSISRLKELQLAQQRGLNQNGKYMVRDSTGFHREMEASDLSNAIKAAETDLVASINGISGAFKDLEGIVDPLIKVLDSFGEGADDLVMGFSILSDILSTASSTSNSFSNLMGLSVGKDDKGNAISLADKLGLKNAGLWGAVAGAALGAISSIAGAHDKKLDKAIEKSKQKVKELENAYKNIEDAISTQLGEATRSQTESMVKNLEKQRSELYKQLEAEEDKKKTDDSKVSDYKQQIHEVEREMALFYKNLASEQYGVDLKGWSSQIAKSLTDAFAKGEDAAIAFKRTTSEILSSLVTEMINLNVIQKALKGVEDYLFGANGIATNNSEGGAKITKNEAIGLSNKMQEVEGSLTEAKEIWDALNEATGGALETVEDVSKSGLTSEIKGVTEDTANLLGSYLNAIRQSVHVKQQLIEKLVVDDIPKINYLSEAQLRELSQIQVNTARNVALVGEIRDLMNRVVDKGSNKLKV